MKQIYYVHGDQKINDSSLYFCMFCDSFEQKEHFYDFHKKENHAEKYIHSLNTFNKMKKKYPQKITRMSPIISIFAGLYLKPNPHKGKFYNWLIKQKDRNDPIGDLAADVISDSKFPFHTDSITIIRNYLLARQACSKAFQALEEAWMEFKPTKFKPKAISLSLRFDVFKADNYACQICGAKANDGVKLEVDHKIPKAKGGTNEINNLWTLCFKCNRGKGTKDL